MPARRLLTLCLVCGCGPQALRFGVPGPLSGDRGRGSFRFGAATAGMQIEEGVTSADWYWWLLPVADGGKGRGHDAIGDGVDGYSRGVDDVALLTELHADAYRFNPNWARIEPVRGQYDQAALQHYDAVIDALVKQHVKPMVQLHHFSSPLWVDDFTQTGPCM